MFAERRLLRQSRDGCDGKLHGAPASAAEVAPLIASVAW